MASLADSNAHFVARATEYSVPNDTVSALALAGVRTMGHLAFAINRPGQDFEESKFEDWVKTVHGGVMPTLGTVAALRRLHFEAEIIVTSTFRASVEQPAESATPKPLPHAERAARMNQIKTQFTGLNVSGVNEPAQGLLDECVFQFEHRLLRYIEPAKCNSRESEVMTGRSDRKLRIEANSLSVKESKNVPDEDVGNAYKLQQCLRRRAIAYEFANLISFACHERYIDRLMRRLNAEPPANYQATSMSQILRADRQVWVYLSQNIPDIRPAADGTRPLDKGLEEALTDYDVTFHLLPLPLSSQSAYAPVRNREFQRDGNFQRDGSNFKGAGKKGKSKSKGSSQGSSAAPRGVKGAVGRDGCGRPLCFNFNLSECPDAPVGGTCNKGRHVCFKANCFKAHAFCNAHKDEMPKGPD